MPWSGAQTNPYQPLGSPGAPLGSPGCGRRGVLGSKSAPEKGRVCGWKQVRAGPASWASAHGGKVGFSMVVAGPLRGGSTGGRWELSASGMSAAVRARNRLFLLYPKRPGREPGLLQRSSGAQVSWVPCGTRTPATFETSRISCVVALAQSRAYSTVPGSVVSEVGSHVGLFFFFPWALHSGSVGVLLHPSPPLFWEISGWASSDLTRFPWTFYVCSKESPAPLLPVT